MEKILVGIHAPAVKLCYDAFVPTNVPVGELTPVIADGLQEISAGKYEVSTLEMLSLSEPQLLLDPSLTLKDYGVRDGMQLYLI